jgi:xanthine dehydrogenase molybdopterin-binding subunit B
MISQGVLVACICAQVVNKRKRAQRVAMGKPADMVDTSMDRTFVQMAAAGPNADGTVIDHDRTDFKNEDFVYVY